MLGATDEENAIAGLTSIVTEEGDGGSAWYPSRTKRAQRKKLRRRSRPHHRLLGRAANYYSGYKGPISAATGAINADYVLVQMCASVATDAATPEAAAAEAERRAKRYLAKRRSNPFFLYGSELLPASRFERRTSRYARNNGIVTV